MYVELKEFIFMPFSLLGLNSLNRLSCPVGRNGNLASCLLGASLRSASASVTAPLGVFQGVCNEQCPWLVESGSPARVCRPGRRTQPGYKDLIVHPPTHRSQVLGKVRPTRNQEESHRQGWRGRPAWNLSLRLSSSGAFCAQDRVYNRESQRQLINLGTEDPSSMP